MSGDIRVSNPSGTSLYEALSIKPQPAQKEVPQETVQPQLDTKDKSNVKTQEKGKVAQNNVEFVDQKESEPKPIPLRVKEDGTLSPNEGKVGKFVVDDKGLPVLDKDGNILVQSYATAQGEWMTEDFVPFKGDIKIPSSYIGPATLVLHRSNASGLPENDAQVSFPFNIEY